MNQSLKDNVMQAVNGLKSTVEAMQRRQELQQYEIQGLKEILLKERNK